MWSVTSRAPTLQQVVDAGADARTKRDEYISDIGKLEENRRLEHWGEGQRWAYWLACFSSSLFHLSESLAYQTLRNLMIGAAFCTIAFAVNGSIDTAHDQDHYDSFNLVIDSCFIVDGVVKGISLYAYAKALETYDILNSRAFEPLGTEKLVKKYRLPNIFKHSGFVDFVIAIICLAYNGERVADWFRLIRIVIISIWALEHEPRIAILLSGIAHGVRSMTSLVLLMVLINVIFASIAITTFAQNDPYNFGSMPVAMWSFFEMSTMEGWSTVLDINRKGCDSVPGSDYEMRRNESVLTVVRYGGEFYLPVCSQPSEQPFSSTIIILSYIVIVGFILTSITIGAISSGINERFDVLKSRQHALEVKQEALEELERDKVKKEKEELEVYSEDEKDSEEGKEKDEEKEELSGNNKDGIEDGELEETKKEEKEELKEHEELEEEKGNEKMEAEEEDEDEKMEEKVKKSAPLDQDDSAFLSTNGDDDPDDDPAPSLNHDDIYEVVNDEEGGQSFTHFNNNALALNTLGTSQEKLTHDVSHYSDYSLELLPATSTMTSLSPDFDIRVSQLPSPPPLNLQSTSDQRSFRTCVEDQADMVREEAYDIFCSEVRECLDIIALERDVNETTQRKKRFAERRSASHVYLRGQLTKTMTGLKKSDLKLNEMKSKEFHVLMYKFKSFVYGDTYGLVMFMFILLAAAFEIFTLSNPNRDLHRNDGDVFKVQLFIQLVFTVDVLLHFIAMFPHFDKFLLYQWNAFDLLIVMVLWLPFMGDILESYIGLLRVLRLVALIKFMKWVPQLAYILDAIILSFRLLLYTVLLMGVCLYYFAVAGVLLFKENDPAHFGRLHTSLLSMVSVATFDNWALTCRTNMYGCDLLGYNTGDEVYDAQCTSPHGLGWWASLYFLVFIIVANYIMINLMISIIMSSMEISYNNSKEVDKMWLRISQKKKKYHISNVLMKKILAVFVILDFNSSCAISLSAATPLFEFMKITEHTEVLHIFNQIDEDNLGSIDFPEFIEMLFFLEQRDQSKRENDLGQKPRDTTGDRRVIISE